MLLDFLMWPLEAFCWLAVAFLFVILKGFAND